MNGERKYYKYRNGIMSSTRKNPNRLIWKQQFYKIVIVRPNTCNVENTFQSEEQPRLNSIN